jgi:uncharacterized membrane protein
MSRIEKSIEVNVPVSTAYNQWTQFESFPEFMQGVKSVRQTDPTHLHWTAEIGGEVRDWDAEISEQEPDRLVSWRSINGAPNAGRVRFEPLGSDRTRITLEMDYEPEGFKEKVGEALGFVGHRVEGDLERFKEFIERRGAPTGGYRGEVEGGREVRP